MKVYSYVVRCDTGFAPNPFWGYCTLAACTPNHMGIHIQIEDLKRKYQLLKVKIGASTAGTISITKTNRTSGNNIHQTFMINRKIKGKTSNILTFSLQNAFTILVARRRKFQVNTIAWYGKDRESNVNMLPKLLKTFWIGFKIISRWVYTANLVIAGLNQKNVPASRSAVDRAENKDATDFCRWRFTLGLCLLCANDENPRELVLCNLNRLDQSDEKDEFKCSAFKPKNKLG
jgi:Nucleotide modification associated domain 2